MKISSRLKEISEFISEEDRKVLENMSDDEIYDSFSKTLEISLINSFLFNFIHPS